MTGVTTLWYIDSMAITSVQPLKHLLRNIAIFIIALGIAGLGALTAGQLTCGPECSVHVTARHQPSCCKPPAGSSQVKNPVSCAHQENHQPPSSACRGTLCTETSFDVRENAAFVSTALDMDCTPRPVYSAEPAVFQASRRPFGTLHYPLKNRPIYMLTCVYLI